MVTAAVSRVAKVTRNSGDEAPKCHEPCPYIFEPVCGWDGAQYKFFGNECFMKKHNCEIEAEGKRKLHIFFRAFDNSSIVDSGIH